MISTLQCGQTRVNIINMGRELMAYGAGGNGIPLNLMIILNGVKERIDS